ncbi:MAG: ABC transporter ATP-binding protein [Coprobacillaceae bacterium]
METICIEIKNLEVQYDTTPIITNMNVTIPKNKITMIIGANGCGKSTLLKTIGRILQPKTGEILLEGKDIKKQPSKILAKQMAILPQNPTAPSGLKVRELVAYGRFPYQSPMGGLKKEDINKINWAMEVTGIIDMADRMVESLSGGQRQSAWIALTLAQETPILLLDEPTTYLDMSHQLEILQLLKKLNLDSKITIIMVLHELNNATKFSDYLIGMKDGKLVFTGPPKEVVNQRNLEVLYGIQATLQLDKTNTYPICTDFELIK